MFLTTLLPQNAEIVTRGGTSREAWGHPLEPTAQYNHMTEGRTKPPLCPWRIEVGDPTPGTRTLFLHVFEIADETNQQPATIHFVPPAGVDIEGGWRVRFESTGPLGGKVGERNLTTSVQTSEQYADGGR